MTSLKPIELIGAVGSPYTRKMLSLLRYRHIPHRIHWGDPSTHLDQLGIAKPTPVFLPTFLLKSQSGALEAVCDSTPIIRRLENYTEQRSVIPSSPALSFVNYLLEDYADEWCTKFMFHYRWHFSNDADNAGIMLPLTLDVTLDEDSLDQFSRYFSERQIGRLGVVGSNDTTAPVIDQSYRRLLGLLDAHFKQQPFLLGHRPASCDFSLYGQLSQLVGFDPTPRAITYELSPRTAAWTQLMEDQSGLNTDDNHWLDSEELPETLTNILKELGRTYAPALIANAGALEAGEKQWQTLIDGANWTQNTFPYQVKCLIWIREEFQRLSDQNQALVKHWLAGTGCESLLSA